MSKSEEEFKAALVGKKIPILTLDNKWHRLFTQSEYTPEIKRMESELNALLKRQGKVNEDGKEIKKLEKRQEECKRLLAECNEKLDACEEEMVELPRQINQLNNRLMVATMEVCYRKLQKNTAELKEIEDWIGSVRRELKKKIIRKQEKEAKNHQLYSYMHDIFGAEVLELFDMQYDPSEKYKAAQAAGETAKKENAEDQNGGTVRQTDNRNGEDALKS